MQLYKETVVEAITGKNEKLIVRKLKEEACVEHGGKFKSNLK